MTDGALIIQALLLRSMRAESLVREAQGRLGLTDRRFAELVSEADGLGPRTYPHNASVYRDLLGAPVTQESKPEGVELWAYELPLWPRFRQQLHVSSAGLTTGCFIFEPRPGSADAEPTLATTLPWTLTESQTRSWPNTVTTERWYPLHDLEATLRDERGSLARYGLWFDFGLLQRVERVPESATSARCPGPEPGKPAGA